MHRHILGRTARLVQAGLQDAAAVNTRLARAPGARDALASVSCALSEQLAGQTARRAGAPLSWRPPCAAYATAAPQAAGPLQQFRLAQTGEGIKECELVRWFVAEGQAIEEFGPVCEVQSDKATIEISSPYAGVVRSLHHAPGDVIQVGEVLADIEAAPHDDHHHHHASVALGVPPPETSSSGGASVSQAAAPGDAVGATAGVNGQAGVPDRVLTSPAVRALAREHGLDLHQVVATGPGGRVTKGDVLAYLDSLAAAPTTPVAAAVTAAVPTTEQGVVAATSAAAPPPPHVARPVAAAVPPRAPGSEEEAQPILVPLRGYRRAMFKSMTAAAAIPHFHYCDEVQMDQLMALRAALRDDPVLAGAKLTVLPFMVKAAALAIRKFPLINASLAEDGSAILEHQQVNVGVAMATPHGLVVPNIKHVESKSVAEIAQEVGRLQAAALANTLRPADLAGGTFTISNIGTIGGTYATPLVNVPEVAILALGRVSVQPRYTPGTSAGAEGARVVPTSILNISLGADHRVVDGATLAGFARAWAGYVERPGSLLLHLQ